MLLDSDSDSFFLNYFLSANFNSLFANLTFPCDCITAHNWILLQLFYNIQHRSNSCGLKSTWKTFFQYCWMLKLYLRYFILLKIAKASSLTSIQVQGGVCVMQFYSVWILQRGMEIWSLDQAQNYQLTPVSIMYCPVYTDFTILSVISSNVYFKYMKVYNYCWNKVQK